MTAIKSPIIGGQRQCTKCGTIKPVSDFYQKIHYCSGHNTSYTGASDHMSECKNCFRERMRARHEVIGR